MKGGGGKVGGVGDGGGGCGGRGGSAGNGGGEGDGGELGTSTHNSVAKPASKHEAGHTCAVWPGVLAQW